MTRKTFLFSALLFVACLMFAGWTPLVHAADAPATVSATPQNVILISWDGLDRRILKQLLEEKKLPHLAALIEEGSLREITVVGHITVTKPGHAEMLTGLDIKDTGVESNMKYRPIPQGYTLFERVQKFLGGKEKIRTFMVTGKIAHVGGRGPGEGIGERPGMQPKKKFKATPGADDSPEKEVLGEPFFLTKKALDVFDADQRHAKEVGELAMKYLDQYKSPRFLAFIHFADPDEAGHGRGMGSPEYSRAAVRCDNWLGKIVAWLKKEGLSDKTLIYVMADHGFDDMGAKGHKNAPLSWLATNDKTVMRDGIIADVPVTIMERFGIDVDSLQPKLLGHTLSKPLPAGVKVPEIVVTPEKVQEKKTK